jgi:lysophospholipid acyltransferase (LPLAT)-like uncharacterized protein
MSSLRELLVRRVLPPIVLRLYRGLGRSWRYVTHHPERFAAARASQRPLVGAFLHARTFQLLSYFSRPEQGEWVLMCSKSRDGDAMAYIEQRLGFQVVRGSSGQGGARALVSLIKLQRSQPKLATGLSIDGSRGPRGIAQAGGLILAQKTGGLVLPIAASTRHGWVYQRSWDRIVVPRPFAEIHVDFGEAIAVPADADEATLERLRLQLENAVLQLHESLDLKAGFSDTEPLRSAT